MAVERYPILVWEDHAGGFTAAIVPDSLPAAAYGSTPATASAQLKNYLEWEHRRSPWLSAASFEDPQLLFLRVDVRPEYQSEVEVQRETRRRPKKMRTFASQETIALRLPAVTGRDAAGLLLCAMPTLGVHFTYYESDSLKDLATHAVQNYLKSLTPQQLAAFLPPRTAWLESLIVNSPRERAETVAEVEVPNLSAIAEPLDARRGALQLSRPWRRDAQVDRLVQSLTQERASVILLGESGSGKSAVIGEAVRKARRSKDQPPPGPDEEIVAPARHRYWLTSAGRLISGMSYLGQWQQRCEAVIAELNQIGGVLCVENVLELLRAGGTGPGDSVAAFLVPYLQRGEVRLVGEATPAELDACRRLLPGFAELFQVQTLPPFTQREAIDALSQVAAQQRQQTNIEVAAGTIELLCRLFARFMPNQPFPGRASTFLIQLFDRARIARQKQIDRGDVVAQLVRQTGLPERLIRDEIAMERQAVVDALQAEVIGQSPACAIAANVIITFKAGLNDPGRPLGVLLLCGPTGVGKTELAKAMSRFLFGHGEQQDRLLRIDMSEYAGPGAAQRFLGDARGNASPMIQRVRQQPFGVVLFDEIEKASPEIFDLLLALMDEGRLSDAYGRQTSFRSTIVIMTSNLGATQREAFGLSRTSPTTSHDADAMRFFRPEFYNRLDAVVDFQQLEEPTMRQIIVKELTAIASREGLRRADLTLSWSDAVVRFLLEGGFDRRYGARPLQRLIEAKVVVTIARYLLDHPATRGTKLHLDIDPTGVIFVAEGR